MPDPSTLLCTKQTADAAELMLRGRIDHTNVDRIREALVTACARDTRSVVRVDLSEVHFLGRTALLMLMANRRLASVKGVRLRLENPSPSVQAALRRSRVRRTFDLISAA